MVIGLLLASVWAAPVTCSPADAASLIADARIPESRAPVSHSSLLPGLARSSRQTGPDLRAALEALCTEDADLSIAPAERWEAAGWSAHTFLLTRTERRGCSLYQQGIAITVGLQTDTPPQYRLRGRLPLTRTPIGDCDEPARWRDETSLGGDESAVRLVLATQRTAEQIDQSEVLVRWATPMGWREQTLLDPAPERLLTPRGSGPRLTLTERGLDRWVVAYGDRSVAEDGTCLAHGGQTVWRPTGTGRWERLDARDALALLASRGLWRLAGDDGWLLIVAQAEEGETELVETRRDRLLRRYPHVERLHVLPSAWFPELNPGFVILSPDPWPTATSAREGRRAWRRRWRAYIKRAWRADDPCRID